MKKIEKELLIKSTAGLHAELASKIVQAASKYSVDFELIYKDRKIDLKSILGLMSLAIPAGENVKIVAIGEDADKAILEVAQVLG